MRRALLVIVLAACSLGGLLFAWAQPPEDDAARAARVDAMYEGYKSLFEGVPEVSATELQRLLSEGEVVLVDVREPAERAVSTLPGAWTPETFEARKATLGDRLVVAYCTIGYRSGEWAKSQRAAGMDVRNLAGSLLAWTHAGGVLEHEGKPTRRLHVYGPTWNLARSDYEPVW